jgi:hypothetical protein
MAKCAAKDCGKDYTKGKGWGKYCSAKCGNRIRSRKHRAKAKKAIKFYEMAQRKRAENISSEE